MADDPKSFAVILPSLRVVQEAEKLANPLTRQKVKFLQNVQYLQEQNIEDIEPIFWQNTLWLPLCPIETPAMFQFGKG